MSYFSISNLQRSITDNSDNKMNSRIRLDSIDIEVNVTENFNSLKFKQHNYTLFVLGNPILKSSFNDYINSLDLGQLFSDNSICFDIFNQLNGITSLIILNEVDHLVGIITDPMGFFPIFMIENEFGFLITNELRQIHNYYSLQMEWDLDSIDSYYYNGHFISGRTWFKNCIRVEPSTFLIVETKLESTISRRYWNWSELKKSNRSEDELCIDYYRAFTSLFKEIEFDSKVVGIGLSGGLDSRWLAFEFSKLKNSAETYSFSEGNRIDLRIAKKVSEQLNLKHKTYKIEKSNWFQDRLNQFYECDGLLPIFHFHEGNVYDQWRNNYDLIATGFYGGGIYSTGKQLNQRINSHWANKFLRIGNLDPKVDNAHYDINSLDPYLAWQKIAQCGAIQVYTISKSIRVFIPFYNMNWLKINYSIDEQWQAYSKFYLEVLNRFLPKNIMNVMWQRTFIAANYIKINFLIQKLNINRIIKIVLRFFKFESNFVDYRMLESEIQILNKKLAAPEFIKNYQVNTIEHKLRKISIQLWYNMWNRKSSNVI